MQTVKRITPNAFPLLDEIDRLYAVLSDEPTNSLIVPTFDEQLSPIVDVFNTYGDYYWTVKSVVRNRDKLQPTNSDKIILAFSGGKDSIASALKYKNEGTQVYLYHMRHINPSFSDEWRCAKESADILGLPIFFDDIQFSGHHIYMEHPMKNMLIANGALSYGIREDIGTTIAFGNYSNSYLVDNVFERCAGDCVDMWESYSSAIQSVIPEFSIHMNLENMGDTLNILADREDLLNTSLSCLCRHSLRDYRRGWVKDKFGVELPRHRCGSCYKCCVEYIYLADHDKIAFSEDYYKYCFGQLVKVAVAEHLPISYAQLVWDNFLFYSIDESKIADQLESASILWSRVKWK